MQSPEGSAVADAAKTHVVNDWAHSSPLVSCRFDPTGRFVFAGAEDSRVWRFALADGAKTEFSGHESWVRAIGFDPAGDTMLTAGYDGRLAWSPAGADKPDVLRVVPAHEGWIRALSVSADGSQVATGGNDRLVKVWNVADGALVQQFSGHEGHVYNVAFHPASNELVSADLFGKFIHWDVAAGRELRRFAADALSKYDEGFKAHIGGARGMAFSPDGKKLLASGMTNVSNAFAGVGNPLVVVIDWAEGKETMQHSLKDAVSAVAWSARYHPQGLVIAALGGQVGGLLAFWKPEEKTEFHRFALPNTARDLDLHVDGLRLATAHHDRHLRISQMSE